MSKWQSGVKFNFANHIMQAQTSQPVFFFQVNGVCRKENWKKRDLATKSKILRFLIGYFIEKKSKAYRNFRE